MRSVSAAKLGIVMAAAASAACGVRAITHIAAYPELARTRSIYLAELGEAPGAVEIRERIRQELIRSGRFTVAEVAAQADASMLGTASVAPQCVGECYGALMAEAVLRLVDTKTQKVTWIFRDSCNGGIPAGADCVAESLGEHLLDAARDAARGVAEE